MARTETDLRKIFGDHVVEHAKLSAVMGERVTVSDHEQVCLTDGQWYAVAISGRQHKLACEDIAALGYVPYLPLEIITEAHGRGTVRTVERPMFGPYMFVRCPSIPQCWRQIATARGVAELVGTMGKPSRVHHGEIEAIRLFEAESYSASAAKKTRTGTVWHFSPGDIVRIKGGPLASLYAQLETSVDEHDRIKATVHIFGRSSLTDLSAYDIEAT